MDILFSCYTGSKMYNLETENSDTDMIVVYQPTYNDFVESHLGHSKLRNYTNVVDKDENNRNTSNAVDVLNMDIYTFVKEFLNGSPNAFEVASNDNWISITNVGKLILDLLLVNSNLIEVARAYSKMSNKYMKRYKMSNRGKDLYHCVRSSMMKDRISYNCLMDTTFYNECKSLGIDSEFTDNYKISSNIRSKIGISNNTNYIKNLLVDLKRGVNLNESTLESIFNYLEGSNETFESANERYSNTILSSEFKKEIEKKVIKMLTER